MGYCLGGILVTTLLSYLSKNPKNPIASATLMAVLVDFSKAGDIRAFIDEDQVALMEKEIGSIGYLEGNTLKSIFSMLRANDFIWSGYIKNYLMGEDPSALDMLYWNEDTTHMPATMHRYYIRHMYLNNKLIQRKKSKVAGHPIDLFTVQTPTFLLSTLEDHIAPWKSSYPLTQIFKGPIKYVLGGSGHVAGVFNPSGSQKYGYWTSESSK
jgi:polyhydroxyalkanoate synthase